VARILLLEDNLDLLNMTAEVLELAGHEVLRGRSGKDGLDLLESATMKPDVILTDLSMPEMDGDVFIAHVRQDRRWMHIPTIIVSGEINDRVRALAHGANDFLLKPYRQTELLNLMRQLVVN
jgi:CheY-like chemotaxis protein